MFSMNCNVVPVVEGASILHGGADITFTLKIPAIGMVFCNSLYVSATVLGSFDDEHRVAACIEHDCMCTAQLGTTFLHN